MSRSPGAEAASGYAERYRTPWWSYLLAVLAAFLLGSEFFFAVWAWLAAVIVIVLMAACVLAVWRMSSTRLSVHDRTLTVPAGDLDLSRVERAIALSQSEVRRLVGRYSDPRAVVYVRSWVGPGVQLVLRRGDEVPYWLVSTRHPDALLAALESASVPVR